MNLLNIFKNFKNDESGAVTVDWVVLTAAVVGLGLAVSTTVGGAINTQASTISTQIGTAGTSGTSGSTSGGSTSGGSTSGGSTSGGSTTGG